MTITAESTVREIAVENPSTVRVFEKLGIDYCCGGGKTLQDACASTNVDPAQLIERLRAAEKIEGDPDLAQWQLQPLAKLIQHIVRKHHGFVRDELPRLRTLSEKVRTKHGGTMPEMKEIEDRVIAIDQEMTTHMLKEEQVLFPYIAQMEHEVLAGKGVPPSFFGTVKNPIASMMQEHDAAGELLKQIRSLSNGYTLPEGACPTFRALYSTLQEFEQDLHRHVHLENNILFPRAVRMEATGRE
jgi:regulator of cell morphogenesis and NO signaling